MNYKKRYNELVGKMKKAYLYTQTDSTKAALEDILPELKDTKKSEDEKIKKSLIHLVHLYVGDFGMIDANTSVEKAIAWLEKQGEQKEKLCDKCKNGCDDEG